MNSSAAAFAAAGSQAVAPQSPELGTEADDSDEGGGCAGAAPQADSDAAGVFAVDLLLAFRVRKGTPEYNVRWSAGPAEDSWEPEEEMPGACIREFWRRPSTGKRKAG